MKLSIVVVISAAFALFADPCRAEIESIGFVKSVSGEVVIISSEFELRAVSNMKVNPGDLVKTGTESSVGLIFEDDTVVSLGPNSEIEIKEFLFSPADHQLSFVARMIRGTFSFITGQIAKLSPEKVRLETPDAILGVRGTKFVVKVDNH